ncbi:hypothetical protein AAHA92_30850 [Salvia divinorum]|uniref:Uncharacterized protein n=1 Tax=Salvia divinorum TaxID=28513 RepID=A0ABD1FUM4_SALDI
MDGANMSLKTPNAKAPYEPKLVHQIYRGLHATLPNVVGVLVLFAVLKVGDSARVGQSRRNLETIIVLQPRTL